MADSSDDEVPTIADDRVVTKYMMTGDIVNGVLRKVIDKCVAGTAILEVCELGDKLLLEETGKVHKKDKEMKKGIAFPTCISVNNVICHYSPLKSEKEALLQDGDLVKIDMGAHIDGFAAVVAHTLVVGASKENKVTGRKADVIKAAYYAAETALRLVKPGKENYTVTDALTKVASEFNCKPVEGMLSHRLEQGVIDGEKAVISNPTEAQRADHAKCEFEVHEVYGVDVLVSTGRGKGIDLDTRTTVFMKKDITYALKMKASRALFSEVEKKHGNMPFTLRSCEDENKAKLGTKEMVSHGLLEPFTVLHEKEGEYVAQFKFTVLLLPNGPHRITEGPFDLDIFESEYSVKDESLKQLLSTSANPKSQKKKKKKTQKAVSAESAKAVTEAATKES